MAIEIVPLRLDNAANATGLAEELHRLGTFGENGPAFDWDFTLRTMMRVESSPEYYFRLAKQDDIFVGAVVGHVDTFFFSPALMALEDAWYVREGVPNRTKIAVMLMRGFVAWALDKKHAVLVQTGDIASIDSHAVYALYQHMGFKKFGTVYKYQRNS